MKTDYIIIQAGGLGTRLEHLTRNRPKAIVPVNNLPIIFHLFQKYGVNSMNGLYEDDERQAIQWEIDGLKQSIQDVAKGTTFNTMRLLDGSMADIDLATNPQGGGLSIRLVNSTLESLGIADYDVTKDFDLDAIDKAIETISGARSKIGAQTNA